MTATGASRASTLDHLYDWLFSLDSSVDLPPLCLEVTLRDGQRFYVRSVVAKDENTRSMVIRIWDMRALNESDLDALLGNLNQGKGAPSGSASTDLHPKLDQANLRIVASEIAYCVEWHARLWPQSAKGRIGFAARTAE